jgi:hypothetical protein
MIERATSVALSVCICDCITPNKNKNEKDFSKIVLHGIVDWPVSGIGMVLWTIRV